MNFLQLYVMKKNFLMVQKGKFSSYVIITRQIWGFEDGGGFWWIWNVFLIVGIFSCEIFRA